MDEWLDCVEAGLASGDREGRIAAMTEMLAAIRNGGADAATAAHRALDARTPALREGLQPIFGHAIGRAFLDEDRLDAAELYLEQAVERAQKADPPDALAHAQALELLSQLYSRQMRFAYAADCARRCLALRTSSLADDDPEIGFVHVLLGAIHLECSQWSEASSHFWQSLEPVRKVGEEWGNIYSFALAGFMESAIKSGSFDKLEGLLERFPGVLHSAGPGEDLAAVPAIVSLAMIKRLRGDADTSNALAARAQTAARQHSGEGFWRRLYLNIADLQAGCNRVADAVEALNWVARLDHGGAQRLLDTVHFSQRLLYSDHLAQATTQLLRLVLDKLPGDEAAARAALEVVLSRKALLTEADFAQSRRSRHLRGRGLDAQIVHIESLRADLRNLKLAGAVDGYRKLFSDSKRIDRQIREAECALAAFLDSTAFPAAAAVKASDVAATLDSDEALIEYVALRSPDVSNPLEQPEADLLSEIRSERFAAFLLRHDGSVCVVDLGKAEDLESLAFSFLAAMNPSGDSELTREVQKRCIKGSERDLGLRLREQVLDPLLAQLPAKVRKLRIAPDGALAAVAFPALPWREGRLVDEFEVSYVSCGRTLLRKATAGAAPSQPLILANPDYDLGSLPKPVDTTKPPTFWFAPLPISAPEAARVQQRLGGALLKESHASRRALLDTVSPSVLHVATHGYFLPLFSRGIKPIGNWRTEGMGLYLRHDVLSFIADEPLLRAGLAFAGVNAYSAGIDLDKTHGDGLVTALDVLRLDLEGTRLVFLSACSTARGMVRPGEGCAGLLQAFEAAGARSVVATLWATADHPATVNLIDRFYARFTAGDPVAAALRNAQRELKQLGVPTWVWASFGVYGDPRVTWEGT